MRMHGMKQKNKMKNKLNNAGMTLIEVLIAMVILAIAIAPLMRSFVQVAYYGNKGRSLQQTSGIAQTVMENCKAYNMKTIQLKFANRTLISHDYTSGASWIDASTGDNYHYFIDDMTVDNREVGMEILVTPMNTTDPVSGIAMPFEADFMDYDNVNDVMDAVFVPQHTMGTTNSSVNFHEMERELCLNGMLMAVLNHIKAADNTLTINEFDLWNDYFNGGPNHGELAFERDITIETINDGGYDQVEVTYAYHLVVNDNEYNYTVAGNPLSIAIPVSSMSIQDSAIIYDNSATKVNNAALERIYFYYYPAFNHTTWYDFPCIKDKITIKNNIGKDVDVYLIKQNNPAIDDSEEEQLEESYYDVKVEVQGNNVVNLYHNFRTNIGKDVEDESAFSSETWPVEYDDLTASVSVTLNDMHSLIIDENRKLMYTIEIKAYANPEYDATSKTMSGDELLSLSGTKINW